MKTFAEALNSLPAPGTGYHPALLGAANIGRGAGMDQQSVVDAIRKASKTGTRPVKGGEIEEAVAKAFGAPCKAVKGAPLAGSFDGDAQFAAMVADAHGAGEADIFELSKVTLRAPYDSDAALLLRELYSPDDVLFVGSRHDTAVRPAGDWFELATRGPLPEHIVPNPFSGRQHTAGDGRQSYRCDAAVSSFRFAVAEFDGKTRAEQLAFWFSAVCSPGWDVVALIDSGGKSIHGWISVENKRIRDGRMWSHEIENGIFAQCLVPLGCDAACRNESRLSRMPGVFRKDKNKWQRLLYLSPDGKPR